MEGHPSMFAGTNFNPSKMLEQFGDHIPIDEMKYPHRWKSIFKLADNAQLSAIFN